jgi:hypothetical protein
VKKRTRVIAVALSAALLAACGGGGSNNADSGDATATTLRSRTKNAALPTTTTATTLPAKGSAPAGATTTTAAGTATTTAAQTGATTTTVKAATGPTTTIAIPTPASVTDPGNFQPTYLASTDPLGSPRVALPAEASATSNAAKTVSTALRTDAAGVLAVSAAEWVGTTTPMTLRWTLSAGGKNIACDNCAFISTKAKQLVKSLLETKFDGSGIVSIRGLDPTATAVGAFAGNGWGIDVVVGDPGNIDAANTGNSIRDWVLGCTGTTASTCRNVTAGIGELKWKNQVWSVSDCISALRNGGPRQLLADVTKALQGADANTTALVRQRAALDRVSIALPAYRPVFATSGTYRTLTGFASTGCAQ